VAGIFLRALPLSYSPTAELAGFEPATSSFKRSRLAKASSNDADRLAKYLARFGLDWRMVVGQSG